MINYVDDNRDCVVDDCDGDDDQAGAENPGRRSCRVEGMRATEIEDEFDDDVECCYCWAKG